MIIASIFNPRESFISLIYHNVTKCNLVYLLYNEDSQYPLTFDTYNLFSFSYEFIEEIYISSYILCIKNAKSSAEYIYEDI